MAQNIYRYALYISFKFNSKKQSIYKNNFYIHTKLNLFILVYSNFIKYHSVAMPSTY
jgi:hypothetical protein